MTFSLLARDPETGRLGGIAATGNLCVGGWVLSGAPQAGMAASQGHAPSTLWREEVLSCMALGLSAEEAVARTVAADEGREYRQLAALDPKGGSGAFTGSRNGDFKGHAVGPNCIASGNILAGKDVLEAMVRQYEDTSLPLEDRLLEALMAGERCGGDERGVLSAAMLVVCETKPPLTLRVDHHAAPVSALADLLARTREPGYAAWLETVPTRAQPQKHPSPVADAATGTD